MEVNKGVKFQIPRYKGVKVGIFRISPRINMGNVDSTEMMIGEKHSKYTSIIIRLTETHMQGFA